MRFEGLHIAKEVYKIFVLLQKIARDGLRVLDQPRQPQLVCLPNWVDKQRIHVDMPYHNNDFFTEGSVRK